jgi:hypothetical protein
MRKVDVFASIGLLGFVALMVFVIIPREAGGGIWHGLSPYFYPSVMLAGVALSSLGLLVQALTRPDAYEGQAERPITLSDLGFFLLISVLIFGSVLILHKFATMIFMGEYNPLRIMAVALPTLAVTWAIVVWGLNIPLP